jgi:hypothetical protein
MNRTLAVLLVASAVITGCSSSPSAVSPAAASPTKAPRLPETGPIQAGTYRMETGPALLITVPAGWVSTGTGVRKHFDEPNEVALNVFSTDLQVFADACRSEHMAEPVGPTAADLLAALRAQENSEISNPVDATVGGLTGMRLEISPRAGLDVTECSIGSLQIWVAGEENHLAGVGLAEDPATVYVADTPGGRLTFQPGHEPGATAPDIAELDAIVASIEVVE